MPLCPGLILAVLALCLAAPAWSADSGDPLSFSGFGTFGYVATDTSEFGFTRDLSQRQRSGLDQHILPDSRLGLQANYRLSPQLELAGQVVARDQVDVSVNHAIEWAFLAFRPKPEIDLRVGRLGLDVFLLSDYRNVGYAYPWVRPVMEFYSWVPVNSYDGIDGSYAFDAGPGRWRVKLLAGRSTTQTPSKINDQDYRLVFDPILGGSLSLENGPWRTKLSFVRIRFDTQPPTGPLTDGLSAIAALPLPAISSDAARLRSELIIEGTHSRYAAIGTSYDDNIWLAQTEYSVLSGGPASVPQGWRGYVSLGRRFGDFMPFAVLARARPKDPRVDSTSDWSLLPGAPALQAAAMMAANAGRIDQRSTSLGLRWEFSNTAALKLQWDNTRVEPYGWGLWPRGNTTQSDTVNVFTTTVDWVF